MIKIPMNDYERQQIIEHMLHVKEINRETAASVAQAANEIGIAANKLLSLSISLRHAANRLIEKDMV